MTMGGASEAISGYLTMRTRSRIVLYRVLCPNPQTEERQ
jgi:hypothetical protein